MNATATPRGADAPRPFAVVTGASSGIGLELARCCAEDGYDLLLAADEADINDAARELSEYGTEVRAIQADLATIEGVDQVVAAIGDRPVDALLANAGRGLGQAFLDQDFDAVRRVLDTNVTGTIALVHEVGREMRARGDGRILITGSIAGYIPGSYQAVYNATKAFLDSFSYALRDELADSGVTVTCLMPGPTDTEFFARAGLLDTGYGAGPKDDAETVARLGYEAMQRGKPAIVTGMKNRMQVAMTNVMPEAALARMHRRQAAPGTAQSARARRNTAAMAVGGVALLAAMLWATGPSVAHGLRNRLH